MAAAAAAGSTKEERIYYILCYDTSKHFFSCDIRSKSPFSQVLRLYYPFYRVEIGVGVEARQVFFAESFNTDVILFTFSGWQVDGGPAGGAMVEIIVK